MSTATTQLLPSLFRGDARHGSGEWLHTAADPAAPVHAGAGLTDHDSWGAGECGPR